MVAPEVETQAAFRHRRPMRAFSLFVAALLTLAGCASKPIVVPAPPVPPPAPPVQPAPPPPAPMPPPPAPALPPLSADWRDWPFSPGNWGWRAETEGSTAAFGQGSGDPASRDALPDVRLHCARPTRRVILSRLGRAEQGAQMTIRTDFGTLTWPTVNVLDAQGRMWVTATRGATDPGLDQIAFSRGRFTVEVPGMAPLVLRPWAELSRVIEDCR